MLRNCRYNNAKKRLKEKDQNEIGGGVTDKTAIETYCPKGLKSAMSKRGGLKDDRVPH